MRLERTDRGRDDHRKRGADTKRHAHFQRHAGDAEAFVEHRHENRAAADAEHAGQESGERADCDQQQRELDELLDIKTCNHPDLPRNLSDSLGSE